MGNVVKGVDGLPLLAKQKIPGMAAKQKFFYLFSVMLNAGLPLTRTLALLGGEQRGAGGELLRIEAYDAPMAAVALAMLKRIETGKSVADTVDFFQVVFTPLQRGLIRVGEESSKLTHCLGVLANYEAGCMGVRSKILAALAYPVAVIIFVFFFLGLAVPLLVAPGYLQLLSLVPNENGLWLTAFLQWTQTGTYWFVFWTPWLLVLLLFFLPAFRESCFYYLCRWCARAGTREERENQALGPVDKGRVVLERWGLRLPWVGSLWRTVCTYRFSYSLSIMLESGIVITRALEIVSRVSDSIVLRQEMPGAVKIIMGGGELSTALKTCSVFRPSFVDTFVRVGEAVGLDMTLKKASEMYADELEMWIARVGALVEPALMLFLGAIVGVLILVMGMPIVQVIQSL